MARDFLGFKETHLKSLAVLISTHKIL